MNKEFKITEWLNRKPVKENETHNSTESVSSVQITASTIYQEIELLTQKVEEKSIDIAPSYEQWRNLAFALAYALGEDGRDFYHRLSRYNSGYSPDETDVQFSACLNSQGQGITEKTIFHLAKEAGINISPISPLSPQGEMGEFGEIEEPEQMPTFSQQIKDTLPTFLRDITECSNSNEESDLLILGTITVISSCLPNVYGNYDGREVFPNLFLFAAAQASAGKGKLTLCRHIVQPIHDSFKQKYLEDMAEYKHLMNEGFFENNEPQEPILKTVFIPANSSSTAVYQMLHNNEGRGLLFETEGDTLAMTFKTDYGNFSDGFRKAFHHEMISYMRRKDNEYVEIAIPKLSTLLSGTPRQILSLIPDAENGLYSRFMFYFMNTRNEWKNVFANKELTVDNLFKEIGLQFHQLYKLLSQLDNPIRFEFTTQQEEKFNAFFRQIQSDYINIFGYEIVASVRRLGLITFRLAMIMTILSYFDNHNLKSIMICRDNVFNNTMSIIKVLLQHMTHVYEMLPSNTGNTSQNQTTLKNMFFESLPKQFCRKDYVRIGNGLGIPPKKADKIIYRFISDNKLRRLEQGSYSKV